MPGPLRGKDSLLYFLDDQSVLPLLKDFAEKNGLWLRRADIIFDLYAYDSKIAVIEKNKLENELFELLRDTFLEPVDPVLLKDTPELADITFKYRYLVFGKGADIPEDVKHFFTTVEMLSENALNNKLNFPLP